MTTNYRYQEPSKQTFDVLPPGEYVFVVLYAEEPHIHPTSGNHVMNVKLGVGPDQKHVFDSPWAGPNGDKIASFLASCGKAPAVGKEPQWNRLEGAKGRCKIKVRPATGSYEEKNEVVSYIFARDIKTYTPEQVAQGAVKQQKAARDPDLDPTDTDDITF